MEDGAVINFGNPSFVAQLILPIDTMGPFHHKQDLQNPLFPVFVRPFLTDVFTGVGESCLGRSLGSDATGEP